MPYLTIEFVCRPLAVLHEGPLGEVQFLPGARSSAGATQLSAVLHKRVGSRGTPAENVRVANRIEPAQNAAFFPSGAYKGCRAQFPLLIAWRQDRDNELYASDFRAVPGCCIATAS